MAEEFYKDNLFGERVDIGFLEEEEEGKESPKWESGFNIFALTDAISARDKRNAWVIYEKALASGMVADEIFWRVMWGVKTLLLAEKCKSAEEADLKPFVYSKAKASLKNWKREELEDLSERLVVGYHEARRGVGEIETMIEKILLNL